MFEIKVHPSEKSFKYEPEDTLLDILLAQKCFVDNPCNGKGVCGKCRVKILNGKVPKPHPTEQKLISQADLKEGIRLSCLLKPESDLEIELLQQERKHKVLTTGYMPKFKFDTNIKKQKIYINRPSLEDQTPFEEQVREQIGASLDFESILEANFKPGEMTVVLNENDIIGIESGDTTDSMYGVAVDIGTTTVVCELIDMISGDELANASMINAQKHFGLDVLTRITY